MKQNKTTKTKTVVSIDIIQKYGIYLSISKTSPIVMKQANKQNNLIRDSIIIRDFLKKIWWGVNNDSLPCLFYINFLSQGVYFETMVSKVRKEIVNFKSYVH